MSDLDAKIVDEGEITVEIQEWTREDDPYRARILPHGEWYADDTIDGAVHKAASRATEELIEEALGDLWHFWEDDDGR